MFVICGTCQEWPHENSSACFSLVSKVSTVGMVKPTETFQAFAQTEKHRLFQKAVAQSPADWAKHSSNDPLQLSQGMKPHRVISKSLNCTDPDVAVNRLVQARHRQRGKTSCQPISGAVIYSMFPIQKWKTYHALQIIGINSPIALNMSPSARYLVFTHFSTSCPDLSVYCCLDDVVCSIMFSNKLLGPLESSCILYLQ